VRIVIVDDSDDRFELIKSAIEKHPSSDMFQVVRCSTADEARGQFLEASDLAVLDLLLPKKRNATPSASDGLNLLKDICNPAKKYIRPRLIVGLTADYTGLVHYREEFAQYASIVLEGRMNDHTWLRSLLNQVDSLAAAEQKLLQLGRNRTLVTVHGIRTTGKWQQLLTERVAQYSKSCRTVELKYGFFDVVSFLIPWFRQRAVVRMASQLRKELTQAAGTDVYLIAHSFGTLIASAALTQDVKASLIQPELKMVVFAGSPLKHDTNIDHIISSAAVTINDCGISDSVLVLARLLVLGLGDAGRVGFSQPNTERFFNRYFSGRHSLYFKKTKSGKYFFEKHWLGPVVLDHPPRRVDLRQDYIGQDVAHFLLVSISTMKPILYVAFLIFVVTVLIL